MGCTQPRSKLTRWCQHDYCLDEQTLLQIQSTYYNHGSKGKRKAQEDAIPPVTSEIYDEAMQIVKSPQMQAAGLVYLKDELYEITVMGDGTDNTESRKTWRIWGSPWSAAFCSMAFNVPRGGPSADLYGAIPEETDILMTHGPPFGLLDQVIRNRRSVGCQMLLQRTQAIKPRLHVWGHIHEAKGCIIDELGGPGAGTGTVYVNAANAGTFARPRRWGTHEYQPIVIDLANEVMQRSL